MAKIPKSLQPILWSADVDHLDLKKDKKYIIHQILMYGDLKELAWLFKTYGKKIVVNVFLNHPSKQYPKETFHFVKNFLLNLRNQPLNKDSYVTSLHGSVRQRTAGSVL